LPLNYQSVIHKSGRTLYKAYYVCPKCNERGKTYVPKGSQFVNCKKCGHGMNRLEASAKGFPETDVFGNVFIAGNFKRMD
jgi:Zn ribbon nucleic-acid-binding protein